MGIFLGITLRAERRAGELLMDTPKNKGGGDVRNHRSQPVTGDLTLENIGVTKNQSSKCMMLESTGRRVRQALLQRSQAVTVGI